ncbi:MAG TPA: bifunctional enoyl-CoA hydratase/phosphate acetyltransferase [Spirochaetota bacterium]|jgi:phosphate butyryltransferase|nr:bifunctional enoyl-CoA hydratase/phosphate acetyltransferase [Spirochaetota bacterium]OQA96844.1 MAG: Phosphate acetyltransferase [Spirochaetes bacterium ADurb.Bin218]HOK01373.1 bifunctional enoyl-CoA hydratase/phosphate acetyltransferase [Spirochaetota bacterium]HOK92520.1 bifunctional enoyl-CoA hydratase/phosphate acetyltransferase [Spirochaetota bacterium]HON16042.1 bifunctional enoyl-CoA hydratase/phosphate acetyltransferase [Spirochaetota bacterium]
MVLRNLEELVEIAKANGTKTVVVAAAEDEHALAAVRDAMKMKLVSPILVGNKSKIEEVAKSVYFPLNSAEIISEDNPVHACSVAVSIVRDGGAEIIMKGLVGTADFLRAILNKNTGIGRASIMSHAALIECANYHKLLCITDAGMNIAPNFAEKVEIVKNAVSIYKNLRLDIPKVAVLAAVEVVNEKMQATVDAAMLTQMNRRGQIKDCIIDGPFAFDNVISKDACIYKGIESDVGGDADIVLCPNLETGNSLYKALTYLAKATTASVMLGAKVPVVLNSRTDSDRSKLMSLILAAAL